MTVRDYFKKELGVYPKDPTLKELPIDSVCGMDCVNVINAAKIYKKIADPHPDVVKPLIQSVNVAIEILWRG